MAKQQAHTAKLIKAAERRRKALRLRREGRTFQQIGDAMGIRKESAWGLVTRALREINAETAETADELRRLELERLDKMLRDLTDECGDWTATNAQGVPLPLIAMPKALAVMERRSKLLALDKPTLKEEAETRIWTQAADGMVDRVAIAQERLRAAGVELSPQQTALLVEALAGE